MDDPESELLVAERADLRVMLSSNALVIVILGVTQIGVAIRNELAVALAARELPASIIVDCSHGNSEKDYRRQAEVMSSLCDQIEQGQAAIRGVMLESHLVAGNQPVEPGQPLTYGQSITDACLSLAETEALLQLLAAAVRKARPD